LSGSKDTVVRGNVEGRVYGICQTKYYGLLTKLVCNLTPAASTVSAFKKPAAEKRKETSA
jgi:hypothetical protein